ncbi:MAG: ATP-binding protein [Pseudomonadota bacterium]
MTPESESGKAETLLQESGRRYEHRIRDLSLMRRLGEAITLEMDTDEAMEFILEIMVDELDVSNGSIMLLDESSQEVVLQCARNPFGNIPREGPKVAFKVGHGIAGQVISSGEPILVADVEKEGTFLRSNTQSVSIRSLICLPLQIRDHAVGVINLSHTEPEAIPESDLPGLSIVANQIAMLIDNLRHYAKMRDVNEILEERVQERTQHLEQANAELHRTRSTLIQSERLSALGQMASGVAHDFNNTLAGIMGNTQLMLQHVKDEGLRQRLRAVELAARDGAVTVKRIQEFSRINKADEMMPCSINDIIADALEVTSPLWKDLPQKEGRTITATPRFGDVPAIMGDAAELREVLTNIVLNAVDAMPKGGNITISSWCMDERVFLGVTDSGVGVPTELRDKLFDPFFTTKGPSNSGLGLSVAYGIVRRHGGELSVESSPGNGATFMLQFPSTDETADEPIEEETSAGLSEANILLIDDDQMVRDALMAVLEFAGHQVTCAGSGQEGINLFKQGRFDIVFTDLGMPGIRGDEVAAAVKAHSSTTPVVLVTGWRCEIDRIEIQEKGVDYLLPKPFEFASVSKMVGEALAHPLQ